MMESPMMESPMIDVCTDARLARTHGAVPRTQPHRAFARLPYARMRNARAKGVRAFPFRPVTAQNVQKLNEPDRPAAGQKNGQIRARSKPHVNHWGICRSVCAAKMLIVEVLQQCCSGCLVVLYQKIAVWGVREHDE